jgi:hypothetical protein
MEKGDLLIIIFLAILITSLIYLYKNLSSFECYMETLTSNAMSDINYEFEPQGSLYGKTKIFRFNIFSSKKGIEYYGMNITNETGGTLFFENMTEPEGGSIIATLTFNESEKFNVDRFFKKKCFNEIHL